MTYSELAVLFYRDGMREAKASRVQIGCWLADAEIRPASDGGQPTAVIKFDDGEKLSLNSWLSVPPRYFKGAEATDKGKAARGAVNSAWAPIDRLQHPEKYSQDAGDGAPAKRRGQKKGSELKAPSPVSLIEVLVNFDKDLDEGVIVDAFRAKLHAARKAYNEQLGQYLAAQEAAANEAAVSAARGRWLREAWSLLRNGKDHRKSVRAIVSALTDTEDEVAAKDLAVFGGDAAAAAESIVSEAEGRMGAAARKKAAAPESSGQ